MCACVCTHLCTHAHTHTQVPTPQVHGDSFSGTQPQMHKDTHTHTHHKPVCELRGTQSLLDTPLHTIQPQRRFPQPHHLADGGRHRSPHFRDPISSSPPLNEELTAKEYTRSEVPNARRRPWEMTPAPSSSWQKQIRIQWVVCPVGRERSTGPLRVGSRMFGLSLWSPTRFPPFLAPLVLGREEGSHH